MVRSVRGCRHILQCSSSFSSSVIVSWGGGIGLYASASSSELNPEKAVLRVSKPSSIISW